MARTYMSRRYSECVLRSQGIECESEICMMSEQLTESRKVTLICDCCEDIQMHAAREVYEESGVCVAKYVDGNYYVIGPELKVKIPVRCSSCVIPVVQLD